MSAVRVGRGRAQIHVVLLSAATALIVGVPAAHDVVGMSPNLLPLGRVGGHVATMPPGPGSPAIDAGGAVPCPTAVDERGVPRPQPVAGLCDIGAVEVGGRTTSSPAGARLDASCVVKITRFEWVPRRVHPGDRTRLWLRARNCTQQTLALTVTEYGKQIPPCPVLDPIASQVVLGPMGRYAPPPFRMVAPPCDGVETMVVTFTDSQGSVVAKATATVRIAP